MLNKKYWPLFLFILIISCGVQAECPYSIKDATVLLTLQDQTNLKITSSAMCNQKEYFADRFFDADVELWKSGKLIGKFYSRRVSYDQTGLKLVLQNTTLLGSDNAHSEEKLNKSSLIVMDLKKNMLSSAQGEVHF